MADKERVVKMVSKARPLGDVEILKDQQRNARVKATSEHSKRPKIIQKK